MNSLIQFFVRRYVFSLSIFLAIIFFGLVSGLGLGVDLLPEFELPIVAVSTNYPGAGSEEMSEQVSQPIEDALATVPGISDISSFSGEGFSFVIAQFNYGVGVDQAATDVKQRIDAIADTLPDDASLPVIQKFDPADDPILTIALTAPAEDLREVQRFAEQQLEPPLQRADGVADVSVIGPVQREIQVLLDPSRLTRYNLTPQQVAGAIGTSSITLPAGSLTLENERILMAVRNTASLPEQVETMLVDSMRGIKVNDVAAVRDSSAAPERFVRVNGEPAVLLEVRRTSGANTVQAARNVRQQLVELELPEGYSTTIIGDTSVFVENSVFDTFRETALAVGAVALIVLLFVGRLGSTFSVVLAIPITILGAVIIFGLFGFTFNVVTLLAITVAVGLVVDDSIVIAENIERYRAMGHSLKDAVYKGAGEVSVAVLTATLSLLAVFLPIAFLPGVIGQFFAQFGISLAATIAVSYLEAMFFLTVRLAYMPNPLPPRWSEARQAPGKVRADFWWTLSALRRAWFWLLTVALGVALWQFGELRELAFLPLLLPALFLLRYFGRLILSLVGASLRSGHEATDYAVGRLRERYGNALRWVLGHSTAVLIIAALMVASIGVVFPLISFNFTTQPDVGIIDVRLELPAGTPLRRTNEVASLLEDELLSRPETRQLRTTVGSGGFAGTPFAERARLRAELIPQRERQSTLVLADLWQEEFAAVIAAFPEASLEVVSSDGGAVPVDTGIELTLISTDLELLREREEDARQIMGESPNLRNVGSSLESAVSERVFMLDNAGLSGTGLTPSDVAQTLRAYNVGISAANLRQGGQEIPIRVKADPVYVRDEQTLLSLPIFSQALENYLPLRELGTFSVQASPIQINRNNQAFVVTLNADLAPGSPGQFQVRREIEEAFRAQGITDNQVQVGTGVGPDLLGDLVFYGPIAFALAIVLNYLVIASQFNSFKYPLYLLLTVPLALVGAFWLFFLTGAALDVISVLGVVILVGLVTKNAILLLDVVVSQSERDISLKEALVEAGKLRLRPILMTAITVFVIGLPLMLGLGEGSEFRQPLGMVILGGVASSTVLTLFVVPAAFYRFERHRYQEPEPEPTRERRPRATRFRRGPAASD